MGKNVRFIATKFSQKCHVPIVSFMYRPYIFGK
jgi:hypothetical protein